MQALQPRPIHLRKIILSVRPELNIKSFRSHTILERGTGWLVSQQTTTRITTAQNNNIFLKMPLRGHRAVRHGRAEAFLKGPFRLIYNQSYPAVIERRQLTLRSG